MLQSFRAPNMTAPQRATVEIFGVKGRRFISGEDLSLSQNAVGLDARYSSVDLRSKPYFVAHGDVD